MKSVSRNRFERISVTLAIAGVLCTPDIQQNIQYMYIHRRACLPGQTDHSNTGIQSIPVNKLVGLFTAKVLLPEAIPLTVKAGSSIA